MARQRGSTAPRALIDPDSGRGYTMPVPLREYRGQTPPHVQVFQETLQALIEADMLTRSEYRVWLWLWSKCRYDNLVPVSQQEVGACLKLGKGEVSRIMNKLVRTGLLLKLPRLKSRMQHYRLSTVFVHRGPLKDVVRQLPPTQMWQKTNGVDGSC